ncbi:MAG TPA: hypothetical protein VL137_02790 [Polyangiaceae bacterium]|nr:hypothetical protein [Polyangiaceae bacterium]
MKTLTMKHHTLWLTLGVACLLSLNAQAQSTEGDSSQPAGDTTTSAGSDLSAGASLGASGSTESDHASADAAVNSDTKSAAEKKTDVAPAAQGATDADAKPQGKAAFSNSEASKGLTAALGDWHLTLYGYAALNAMYDTTQSFTQGIYNNLVKRPGTYAGDHDSFQLSVRDSRLGLKIGAPPSGDIKASAVIEMDFNGLQPAEFTEHDKTIQNPIRMRHYYMQIQTPVVDVLAGQYFDLFGWGGKGFFPSTLSFLGLTGEVYNREAQLRISKTLSSEAIDFEVAVAATRPAQRASGVPDFQAGLRLAVNGWATARQQGYGQPSMGPLAIGVSGITRRFEVAEFLPNPMDAKVDRAFGYAVDAFIPVIPVKSAEKRSNALALTGEFSSGGGIGDLYTELSGGLLFPTLPNPSDKVPPPTYPQNVDSGYVTYDGNGQLQMVKWQGLVANIQYYLPIADGKVWISGSYAQSFSSNLRSLTPLPARGAVATKSQYMDASLFFAWTEALQTGVGFQTVKQTYADGVEARDNRTELGMHFFF